VSGPKQEDKSFERETARKQSDVADKMAALAQQGFDKQTKYEQPIADLFQKIIGGSRDLSAQATAPAVSNISKQYQQAKENILEQTPAGAGRDYALASAQTAKGDAVSKYLNDTWMNAFGGLANLGKENAQVALQQTGAGLRGNEGAASMIGNVMQQDAQGKATTMGFFGQLAGAAGTAVGGGAFKKP